VWAAIVAEHRQARRREDRVRYHTIYRSHKIRFLKIGNKVTAIVKADDDPFEWRQAFVADDRASAEWAAKAAIDEVLKPKESTPKSN
jgi:hypothetical protein